MTNVSQGIVKSMPKQFPFVWCLTISNSKVNADLATAAQLSSKQTITEVLIVYCSYDLSSGLAVGASADES